MPKVVADFLQKIDEALQQQHTLNARVLASYLDTVFGITLEKDQMLDSDLKYVENHDNIKSIYENSNEFLVIVYNPT